QDLPDHGFSLCGLYEQDTEEPRLSLPRHTQGGQRTFTLDTPRDHDVSIGLTIGDPVKPRSGGNYRALVFVNGWNMGQYIANIGPQHTFVVPTGVLNPHGRNSLAIAVTSDGGQGNGLEQVTLTNLGTVRGGPPT
ncbi:beta galactosidase jelly roll domain-containing protein, partial [Kibdelosporangium lantanae]